MNQSIFDSGVAVTLEALRQPSAAAAKKLFAIVATFAAYALVALMVTGFETHIVYATFEFVFGDDDKVWKPWIMALASLILVLAVHFMAQKNAQHPAIAFINRLAGVLIPVYLIGIGILIVVSLYNGGLGDMLSSADISLQPDLLTAPADEPMAQWMSEVLSPLAGVLFSVGIGSLAIVSVFVANHALNQAEQSFHKATTIHSAAKHDNDDMAEYQAAKREHDALQKEIDSLLMRDENAICDEIADEVLLTIQKGLAPTVSLLNKEKYIQRPAGLMPPNQINITALEKAIKPIQSITRDDILKHMK
ncbi:MAG: hypothetical protein ACFHVJ_10900 [Aestuariibacter sp.]